MNIQIVDPVDLPGWDTLILTNPDFSFFHTSAWAKTLVDSYDFRPAYFLGYEENCIVFFLPLMEVNSFLTGRRGVSLPFTDQCSSYVLEGELFTHAIRRIIRFAEERHWRFIEWRDAGHFGDDLPTSELYYIHDIDLRRSTADIFSALSESNRRNINKSIREGIVVRREKSWSSIREFYRLNLITRKRHGLPPQPLFFFRNVFNNIITRDYGFVATASFKGRVIAASVFFHFNNKAIFKYGASDQRYHHLRPNNLIMWEALKWYSERGFDTMSLGRTELNNQGLLKFKRTWGPNERLAKYHLYNIKKQSYSTSRLRKIPCLEGLPYRFPTSVLKTLGHILYRHFG